MKHKKIFTAIGGVLVGLLTANLLSAAIYTLPAKYSVTGKATSEVWEANAHVLLGTEGYAYNHTDQNGYNNPDGLLTGRYALALGSSHTQAFNVNREENYCSLYNEYAKTADRPLLYNAGMDANHFADIVKHFPAAVAQFPDAESYLIETPYFTFTPEQLQDALQSVEYDPTPTQKSLTQSVYGLIQSMPLARLLVRQILETDTTSLRNAFFQATVQTETTVEIDYARYRELLTACFAKLRQTTDKPITLLYHLEPLMTENGVVLASEQIEGHALMPLIQKLCDEYDITLIDPGQTYLDNYAAYHTLPYGFYNTVYGEGHLNETGHRLIADLLIAKDKEVAK